MKVVKKYTVRLSEKTKPNPPRSFTRRLSRCFTALLAINISANADTTLFTFAFYD